MENFLNFLKNNSIALASLTLALVAIFFQNKQNRATFMPIGFIKTSNYLDYIAVEICNKGSGPLIIKEVICKNQNRSEKNLIDFFELKVCWNNFAKANIKNSALLPADEMQLIAINKENVPSKYDQINEWEKVRDDIKSTLKDITVIIKYQDVYKNNFIVERKLETFGQW